VLSYLNRMDWLTRSPMAHIDEVVALSSEFAFPHYLGFALACRGRSLLALGQAQEGLALLTQGLAELRARGGVAGTPIVFTWLAEAHAMLGEAADEQDCLVQAAQIVEATEERMFAAELLHRVPGDLRYAAGDRSAAEQHYRQAIAVAERQSAKLFQLRASTSLARLWRDQGKRIEARDLLGPVYHWFTEGFCAPDLKDAKILLDELA
jgi:tetratricopeptide (TPR) repeat protein